jgi:structural maintenance of chromosome 2
MRSVTLDGDVYDPSGTLSGGSAPSGDGVLVHVQELAGVEGAGGEVEGGGREDDGWWVRERWGD